MAEKTQNNNYRKKQALAVILVFVCIVAAFLAGSAPVAVGAILAACGLCYWAAKMQPETPPEEHH
jgi:hypothetical protein